MTNQSRDYYLVSRFVYGDFPERDDMNDLRQYISELFTLDSAPIIKVRTKTVPLKQ